MATRDPAHYRDLINEITEGGDLDLGAMARRRLERQTRDRQIAVPGWLGDLELESWLGTDICYHAKLAGRSELMDVPGKATASAIHLTFYVDMKVPDRPGITFGAITIKLVSQPDLRDLAHLLSPNGLDHVADIIRDASGLDVGPLKYLSMNGRNIEVVGSGTHLEHTIRKELDPVLPHLANPTDTTLSTIRAAARNG